MQGQWTKGKLCCPSCKTRVGGFDFVGSSGHSSPSPVYIVRSKVDVGGVAAKPLVLPGALGAALGAAASPSQGTP